MALIGATRKMQTGDRNSFNRCDIALFITYQNLTLRSLRWLRFRVIAQGVTVAAAVVGGWQISQDRRAARNSGAASNTEDEAKRAKDQAEQARFSARLKEAEEAHQLETRSGVK